MNDGFRSPTPVHTAAEAAALLVRLFEREVSSLHRVDLGVMNAVYEARLSGALDCYLKVAPRSRGDHRLREEVWAFARCRALGVPVPEVLAFEPEPADFPEPYHVTRRIRGENGGRAALSREERLAVLRELGGCLARMHTVALQGFGYLRPVEGGYAGEHATLWENLSNLLDEAPWWEPIVQHGLATTRQIEDARHRFERHRALFEAQGSCLVYADGGLNNLVVRHGRLVGVVDMENVVAGEPVNEFDALTYESEEEFEAVCEGYGRPELFDGAFRLKLALYRLLFAFPRLDFFRRRGDAEPLAATRQRILRLEAELGPA